MSEVTGACCPYWQSSSVRSGLKKVVDLVGVHSVMRWAVSGASRQRTFQSSLCLACFAVFVLISAAKRASAAADASDDYWEDEKIEAASPVPDLESTRADVTPAPADKPADDHSPVRAKFQRSLLMQALSQTHVLREGLALLAVSIFVANIFTGRKANRKLAVAFAKAFCDQGGIFDRNFAQTGECWTINRSAFSSLQGWSRLSSDQAEVKASCRLKQLGAGQLFHKLSKGLALPCRLHRPRLCCHKPGEEGERFILQSLCHWAPLLPVPDCTPRSAQASGPTVFRLWPLQSL